MTLQQRERIGSIIRSVVVIAIALICAVPLYVIVINTFKSSAEMSMDPIGLPKTWNFENYTYAFGHLPIVNAFKNTIIVMTSNIGSPLIQAMVGQDSDDIKEAVWGELKNHFRPEFLNRIDETVVFHGLDAQHIRAIADIQLQHLRARLEKMDLQLQVSDQAMDELAKVGFDPVFGARPLKRAIQQRIENPLSRLLLEGQFPPKSVIAVGVDPVTAPGVFKFTQTAA